MTTTPFPRYRIPASFLSIAEHSYDSALILRDEHATPETLEQHMNDLYQLLMARMGDAMLKNYIAEAEEEALVQLARTICGLKRRIAQES